MNHELFRKDLDSVLDDIRSMLIEKNESYGDSALSPIRIFSKADTMEQLKVRIDDKINRLKNGSSLVGDNDIKDLAGYFVIYLIAEMRSARK